MEITKATCTECNATLTLAKPVEVGKKVRCSECDAVFVVRDEEPEVEDRPKKKKKFAKKGSGGGSIGWVIGILVVGLLLLVCCGGGAVVGVVLYKGGGVSSFTGNPKVTKENYNKIRTNQPLSHAEDVLGKGESISSNEVNARSRNPSGRSDIEAYTGNSNVKKWYCWQGTSNMKIFVGLAVNKRTGSEVIAVVVYYEKRSDGVYWMESNPDVGLLMEWPF